MANGTFEGLIRSLDVDPHRRGKQFEKIVKWWLQNDPIHSRDIKKVWLWDEWPDRPGPDVGIDLVAELKDGSLVAVQAKCFDSERDIPKSELDSFISAASPRKYGRRMLVASTDGLSANARRMLHDNHVTQVMFSYLDSLQEFWPSTFLSLGGPRTISKWGPRTHQSLAIHDVTEGLRKASRGQLIMACGTGKTLTAMWIMESLDSHSTLVLVPSLSLLSQTLLEWSQHSNVSWSYLCVCSDDTVNKSDDAIISSVDDVPFPVTTKPSEIAHFLSQRGRKIIFSTYQSSAQVARGMKSVGKKFDLVICDEAHRLTGKNDAEFATALDDKKIPAKKRLFMTATPRTYTASLKSKASERGVEITSMDDETMFGKELHKLSFGQAIEQELLTDYRVVIVGVTDPQVQELIERRELVTAGNVETDARTLAAHIGLAKATKDYDLKRTISFHGRIKTAQDFAQNHASIVEWMPDDHKPSGTIWADTITGAMNSSSRRKLLDKLKENVPGQHALLSNARCLTEGIDVPSLDGVAFIDPRSSQVDIIQAVGRAIRKADNKTLGTIVLPVLIPHDADAEHALEDTAFKPIWAILNALRSHDEQFATELDHLRTELGRTSKLGTVPERIIESLPTNIDSIIPNFSAQLSLSLVEHSTNTWDFMFGQLLRFVEQNGHARPPARKVGRSWFEQWVGDQRSNYNSGRLSPDRVLKLESLLGWTWDPLGDSWNKFYELTIQFSEEFGHAAVPATTIYRGQRLAGWINSQRTSYNKGILDNEKISQLEAIRGWTWDPKSDQFERGFRALSQYASRENTARIVRDHTERIDGSVINLGSWCNTRRADYKRGWLSQDQIQRFEALPDWSWNPLEDAWELWFNELLAFGKANGHYLVPKDPRGKELAQFKLLGQWVNTQRTRYNKSKLEPDRIKRLDALSGWSWKPNEDRWDVSYEKVELIATQLGSIAAFQESDKESQFLKAWINTQRWTYSQGELSPDRVVLLELIPGWSWEKRDIHKQSWDESVAYLKKYVEQHGEIPRRSTLISGFKLGEWIKGRRTDYNAGRLSPERTAELESINGWTWDPFEDAWREMFSELKSISLMTPSGIPRTIQSKQISNWITRQRKLYELRNLSDGRIAKLESLKGWNWLNEDLKNDTWTEMYEHLVRFTTENGHSRVRDKSVVNGIKLGTWVSVQRRRYFLKTITDQQIQLLERLKKWSWNPIEDDWQESFAQLRTFTDKYPGRSPQRHNPGEDELSQWVGVQRSAYKVGKITTQRIKLLESIPGWLWEARNDRIRMDAWEESFAALQDHLARGGTLKIAKNVRVDGIRLSSWISIQRKAHETSKLKLPQIDALESLPGWSWDVFGDSWTENYQALLSYAAKTGHSLVPLKHIEDGHALGSWINGQRSRFKKGTLEKERIKQLELVKGWSWAPKQDRWHEYFALIEKYVEKHGHAKVPDQYAVKHLQLGKWVGKQRQKYKNDTLEQSRIDALEALSGWTWRASNSSRTKVVPNTDLTQ